MQIAILHYAVPPIVGGVEVTIAAHARLLRQHGYGVKLIAGRGENATIIPEIDSRHPRVEAVQRDLNRGIVPTQFSDLCAEIARALQDAFREIDLVIAHNVVTLHKNLALTSALHHLVQTKDLPVLAWCHDFAWDDPVYRNDVHDGEPWDLMRRAWKNTRYVVVSESRRDELARLLEFDSTRAGFAPIAVVTPGLDAAEFFRPSPTTARWLDELNLLEGGPLLLLPARVTRRKKIEFAIDIASGLREFGLAPKLVVMGPLGPHNPANRAYLEELKARAAYISFRGVIFLQEHGSVGDDERRDLYALADAMLLPSAREGFGIPILEAGLSRLPIFCADIPPFRESAQDLAHYFALDEPPRQIAARMAEFFAQEARYRLKQRVLHMYNWESIFSERIEPLLQGYRTT